MDTSLLHKAHQAGRKAVKLAKQGLFAESATVHIEAARLFQELEGKISKESLATRSLTEQRLYHQRQAELARKIREVANKDKKATTKMTDVEGNENTQSKIENKHVQGSMRRDIDDFDSLLQILSDTKSTNKSQAPIIEYTKRPKSDKETIEELQTVNAKLRSLVIELWEKIRIAEEEKLVLEKRLEVYEPKVSEKPPDFKAMIDELPLTSTVPELAPLEEPPDFKFS